MGGNTMSDGGTNKATIVAAVIGAIATAAAAFIGLKAGQVQVNIDMDQQFSAEYSRGYVAGYADGKGSASEGAAIQADNTNNPPPDLTASGKTLLMKEYAPYFSSWGYEKANVMTMTGKAYSNGFTLQNAGTMENYYILINTGKAFSYLEFDLGHIDGSPGRDGTFAFYIDDSYIKTIVKSSKASISHEVVELQHGEILRIEYNTGSVGDSAKFGFANVVLVP